jgi:hypothetical protein
VDAVAEGLGAGFSVGMAALCPIVEELLVEVFRACWEGNDGRVRTIMYTNTSIRQPANIQAPAIVKPRRMVRLGALGIGCEMCEEALFSAGSIGVRGGGQSLAA